MPFTNRGLEAKRFSEILPEINQELVNQLGAELDTSPDTVLGVIMSIFASQISTQESLTQAMADNFDVDKASGTFLDSLVALNSLTRLQESFSTGNVFFKVSVDGTNIPTGTILTDLQSNAYRVVSSTQVNSSTCVSAKLSGSGFVGNATVRINGEEFIQVYTSIPDASQVATDLAFLINQTAPQDYTATAEGDDLVISIINKNSNLNITRNENLQFTEVEGRVSVIALETGNIDPPINTVTSVNNTISNVVSVTNYDTFTVGRLRETDEELRIRHQRNPQIARSSTAKAIFSRLSNITGVSLVRIFENTTNLTDEDGRPPHSYECIIEGGNEQIISQEIADSRPNGVQTYGSSTYLVEDYVGSPTAVSWSRPNPKYVNVRVTFSRYDEETLPDNAIESIKEAIVEYGDNLGLDSDIIPQRLYGAIYNAVSGIGELVVEVGTSLTPSNTTPNETGYTTSSIPISKRDKADFNTIRVEVVEV